MGQKAYTSIRLHVAICILVSRLSYAVSKQYTRHSTQINTAHDALHGIRNYDHVSLRITWHWGALA
jgi:hypothetical protein